ncbi:histidine phosphatase family protein [Microbacteriaceae bacterium]|nr:histidine phosphatase family protein [Candidatus Saccharibacteria bacterium]
MAMPNELVFIRHGESEANIVQKRDDHNLDPEIVKQLFLRPDWKHRLTPAGEEQAKGARIWLEKNLGEAASFDAIYVSPFLRTRETAAHITGLDQDGWTFDDRLAERSWGVYGKLPRAEQRAQFPRTAEEKQLNPWYTRLDGGESMPDVYARFRSFQETLHRERPGGRVLAVTHGDFINAARYGIERMTPEEWEALDENPKYTVRNCTILEYSRINPADQEDVREKIHWRRYTYPNAPESSPDGGEWVELAARRRYSGRELISQVERIPRLIVPNL